MTTAKRYLGWMPGRGQSGLAAAMGRRTGRSVAGRCLHQLCRSPVGHVVSRIPTLGLNHTTWAMGSPRLKYTGVRQEPDPLSRRDGIWAPSLPSLEVVGRPLACPLLAHRMRRCVFIFWNRRLQLAPSQIETTTSTCAIRDTTARLGWPLPMARRHHDASISQLSRRRVQEVPLTRWSTSQNNQPLAAPESTFVRFRIQIDQ